MSQVTASASLFGRYVVFIFLAALTAASCSNSPTAPDRNPDRNRNPDPAPTQATPAPAPTPAPGTGSVRVTVNPNPVPFSGQPITDSAGCASSKNTWFYDQVLQETGGVDVTFTNRIDSFDDRQVNNLGNLTVTIPARGSTTVRTRWCSATAGAHSAQTAWGGTDKNGNPVSVTGPKISLMAP